MSVSTIGGPSPSSGGPAPSLTARELELLRRSAHGETYDQIAKGIGVTRTNVSTVAYRLFRKLGALNITHAVFLACRAGLLDGRPQRHGDHAGFRAHERRGEDPWACGPCAAGEREYRAGRKHARDAA